MASYLLTDAVGNLSTPTIGADGTIYIGSTDQKLYAFDPSGTRKWSYLAEGTIYAPLLDADGAIVFASGTSSLLLATAVLPDGVTTKWSTPVATSFGPFSFLNPSLAPSGSVYLATASGSTVLSDVDGSQLSLLPEIAVTTFAPSGEAYGDMISGYLGALDASGGSKWTSTAGLEIAPALGPDGSIYFGSSNNLTRVSAKDGSVIWSVSLPSFMSGRCSVDANGTAYVPAGSTLVAVSSDSSTKWIFTAAGSVSSPAIGADGRVYVADQSDTLYAIGP
jgi:outer membrane protein assembly factor BamB